MIVIWGSSLSNVRYSPKMYEMYILKVFVWLILVVLLSYGHNGQDCYKKIGPTFISTKKSQYIVLEVGKPFTFISMVKSQTSFHINQRLFTQTS